LKDDRLAPLNKITFSDDKKFVVLECSTKEAKETLKPVPELEY